MNTVQVTDELQDYLNSLLPTHDAVLVRMEEEAHRENIGIWLLRATSGGTLTTFETNHERALRARANFAEAGLGKQALVLEEDAASGVEKLNAKFDACFIDLLNSFPSEDVTRKVFDLCMQRLDAGGLLIADNALRQGEVVHPKSQQARNVAFYNQLVAKDSRLESVIVPIRDGVSVARVKN